MEENNERKDFRRERNAKTAFSIRLLAIFLILYYLYQIVSGFIAGGPEAPSVGLLILAVVLLGGGSVVLGIQSYREYRRNQEDAKMTQEEIEAVEALRKDDQN